MTDFDEEKLKVARPLVTNVVFFLEGSTGAFQFCVESLRVKLALLTQVFFPE